MIFKERRELRKRVAELEEMLVAINREANEQHALAMRSTAKAAEADQLIQQLRDKLTMEEAQHEQTRLKRDKALRHIEALEKGANFQDLIEALDDEQQRALHVALRGW